MLHYFLSWSWAKLPASQSSLRVWLMTSDTLNISKLFFSNRSSHIDFNSLLYGANKTSFFIYTLLYGKLENNRNVDSVIDGVQIIDSNEIVYNRLGVGIFLINKTNVKYQHITIKYILIFYISVSSISYKILFNCDLFKTHV